jgi:hypothetical protein
MLFVLTASPFEKKNHKADYALKAQAMKTKKQAFVKVSYVKADDGVKANAYQERPGFI